MAQVNDTEKKAEGSCIVWESPYPEEPLWVKRLTPLLEHPNRWARIDVKFKSAGSVSGVCWHLRNRKMAIPKGRFEFLAVGRKLYARYLGA